MVLVNQQDLTVVWRVAINSQVPIIVIHHAHTPRQSSQCFTNTGIFPALASSPCAQIASADSRSKDSAAQGEINYHVHPPLWFVI